MDALLRTLPLSAFRPLRQMVARLRRHNPLRVAATLVLKRAARANRRTLASRLAEIRPLDQPELCFEPSDSMVSEALFWFGVRGYEGTVPRVWASLCGRARSVLEVGGNVGLFTVVGARATTGDYTVVEPVPAVASVLRANLARNGITTVDVREAAVVPGGPRPVTLNLPDENRAIGVGAHLVEGVEIAFRESRGRITVPGLPIGELASGRDLIKMDAEGIEAALLADIREMIVTAKPDLLIEVLPEAEALGSLLAELAREAGYRIHILPEYGSDRIVAVEPAAFSSALPRRYNSKDVVLSVRPLD